MGQGRGPIGMPGQPPYPGPVPPPKSSKTLLIVLGSVAAGLLLCCGAFGVVGALAPPERSPDPSPSVETIVDSPSPEVPATPAPLATSPAPARPSRPAVVQPVPKPATSRPAPRRTTQRPAPPPPEPADVYYENCAAARAAGAAPLYVGDPGYRAGLDRDHDGIACE
jgi:hypothetical protein